MKKTVFAVLPVLVAFFIFAACAGPLQAEDRIQAFVNPSGKVVFTNLNEISQPVVVPSVPTGVLTLLRDEMPENIRPLVETISTNHGVDPNLVSAVIKAESNFN